jgi:hypothetical protein
MYFGWAAAARVERTYVFVSAAAAGDGRVV